MWAAGEGGLLKLQASDGSQLAASTFGGGAGIAFDGFHIWVRTASGMLNKLRASDLTLIGSFTVGAASSGAGVAFDGTKIWVANSSTNTLTIR